MDYVSLFLNYLTNEKELTLNSINVYKYNLKLFNNFLEKNKWNIVDVNTKIIEYFQNYLNIKFNSQKSIYQCFLCLKKFYDFLENKSVVNVNPFSNLVLKCENVKKKKNYLTKDKINILFSLNKSRKDFYMLRDEAILELFYSSGLTVGELSSIKFDDCNFDKRFIRIKKPNDNARIVPFSESCKDFLKAYISECRVKLVQSDSYSNFVFLNSKGKALTTRGISEILLSVKHKTKFKYELNPTILRNSFVMNLIQNGADPALLKGLMGYKNLDYIERNYKVDNAEMFAEYEKLFKLK